MNGPDEQAGTDGISKGVGLVLHLLRERAAAARRLADKDKGKDDALLQDRARQLEIVISDIEAGMHLPDAVAERSAAEPLSDPQVAGEALRQAQGEPEGEEEAKPRVEPGATVVDEVAA